MDPDEAIHSTMRLPSRQPQSCRRRVRRQLKPSTGSNRQFKPDGGMPSRRAILELAECDGHAPRLAAQPPPPPVQSRSYLLPPARDHFRIGLRKVRFRPVLLLLLVLLLRLPLLRTLGGLLLDSHPAEPREPL